MHPSVMPERIIARRFSIEVIAGSGGMGTVYRARDLLTGMPVALKLLHADAVGIAEIERFGREAKLLAELQHTGIVSHIAHGQTERGQPFLAMEWLDGEDLGQRLQRGTVSLQDALTLLRCVAEALALAHRRGIVHRVLFPLSKNQTKNFQKREISMGRAGKLGTAKRLGAANLRAIADLDVRSEPVGQPLRA